MKPMKVTIILLALLLDFLPFYLVGNLLLNINEQNTMQYNSDQYK